MEDGKESPSGYVNQARMPVSIDARALGAGDERTDAVRIGCHFSDTESNTFRTLSLFFASATGADG